MKRALKRTFGIFVVCMSVIASASHAALIEFSVFPNSGDVAGAPGTTVGWGYSITNNSSSYLVTTAINADLFQHGMPLAIFDFPVIAPGDTILEAFAVDTSGLFQLLWDIDAPLGFVNSGLFFLSSDFYTNDPLLGGVFISSAEEVVAAYSAIAQEAAAPVPEPSTWSLLLITLLALGIHSFRVRAVKDGSTSLVG